MDIKNRLFPYPVLSSSTDDYVTSSFEFQATVSTGLREIIVALDMKLDNEQIRQYIQDGLFEYVIHIECPATSYRTICGFFEDKYTIRIPEVKVNKKVSLCAFVVARRDIIGYRNSDFNEDYKDASFSLERGEIVAIGGQYDAVVTKAPEDMTKLPSIFTICKYASTEEECMKISLGTEKIVISISNSSFENYRMLTNMPTLLPVFHAAVIFPALIYVFEALKQQDLGVYEEYRWFVGLRKTFEKYGMKLDKDTLSETTSYELAQKLLDMPVNRALNAVTMVDDSEEE